MKASLIQKALRLAFRRNERLGISFPQVFDEQWYLEQQSRCGARSRPDRCGTFMRRGAHCQRLRDPNPYFSTAWYCENCPGQRQWRCLQHMRRTGDRSRMCGPSSKHGGPKSVARALIVTSDQISVARASLPAADRQTSITTVYHRPRRQSASRSSSNGWRRSNIPSAEVGPRPLTPRSEPIGTTYPKARSSPPMLAFGPRSPAREPRRTFLSRLRMITGFAGSLICLGVYAFAHLKVRGARSQHLLQGVLPSPALFCFKIYGLPADPGALLPAISRRRSSSPINAKTTLPDPDDRHTNDDSRRRPDVGKRRRPKRRQECSLRHSPGL